MPRLQQRKFPCIDELLRRDDPPELINLKLAVRLSATAMIYRLTESHDGAALGRVYSTLTPVSFTTFSHRVISALTYSPNCSGVPPSGVKPRVISR